MKTQTTILAILGLAALGAQAAVTVTDHGLTAPTLSPNDTGYTGVANHRFGFRPSNKFNQTFTLTNAAVLDSIYTTYTTFDNYTATITVTVDAGNDGTNEISETITLDSANFVGNDGDSDGNPHYWMQWDLSSYNLTLPAGTSKFEITLDSHTDPGGSSAWIFAPTYNSNGGYGGGSAQLITTNTSNLGDLNFAVTVPEPSALLLLGLSGLGLLRRRRG